MVITEYTEKDLLDAVAFARRQVCLARPDEAVKFGPWALHVTRRAEGARVCRVALHLPYSVRQADGGEYSGVYIRAL